jgi:hypothetical protein
MAGVNVFYKNEQDGVFHIYSCYLRGAEMVNGPTISSTSCQRGAMKMASGSRWNGYDGTISIEAIGVAGRYHV